VSDGGQSEAADRAAGWHSSILQQILRLADPAYREGSLMVAPTEQIVHGVRTPDARRLAREWRSSNTEAAPDEILALVESLWSGESRDERGIGLEILYLHPPIIAGLSREWYDDRRPDIDNWGVCDFVATRLLGPWVLADPDSRLSYLGDLVGDPHLYSRRLGLVASVPLNRAGGGFGPWTLRQVDRLLDDREPLITKAVSWVLREMTRHQAREVERYVESRGDRLAPLARREVLNKLRTGRKNGRIS
jgi:3-methyladenine DNA glycosylase AlkD